MDIQNISLNNLSSIQQAVNIKLLKGSMEFQKEIAGQIIEILQDMEIGQNVDLKV